MGVNWNKLKKHEKYQENFGSQINNTNNIVKNVQTRTENILNNRISNTSIILNANKAKINTVNVNTQNNHSTPFMVNKTNKVLEQKKMQDTIQNDLTNGFRNTRKLYDFSENSVEEKEEKKSSILNQIATSAKKTAVSIPTSIENISTNTFESYKNSSESNGYISNQRNFMEELKKGNVNAELPKKENKILSSLNTKLDKYNEQIQNNIENAENPFKKKVQQLIPSTVNSLVGAGASAINPGLGMATFGATSYSDYYKDGQTRGMNDKQANKYAMLMSYWESLGDTIITGGQVSNIKKAFSGKALSQGILDSYSMNVLEGAIQEGVTEPVNEIVAGITGGKDKIDITDMHNRILESAFDGALQEIFMVGMTAGLTKTGQAVNKIKNGEKLSNKEIKEVIDENIKARGKEQVEKELKQGSKNILNQAQVNEIIDNSNLDNESKASLQRVSQKNGWTSEEVQKLIDDRKKQHSTMENKLVLENNQQITQSQNKMAENENIEQIQQNQLNYEKSIENFNKNNPDKAININNDTMKQIKLLADKTNNTLEISDEFENDKILAKYEKGKITINGKADSNKALQNIAIHEAIHSKSGTEGFDKLVNQVLTYAKSKDEYETARADLNKIYADKYENMTAKEFDKLMDEEIVTNTLGEYFGSEEKLSEILNNIGQDDRRTFVEKVIDLVKDIINSLTGYKNQQQYFQKIQRQLEHVLSNEEVALGNEKNMIAGKKSLETMTNDKLRKDGMESYKKAQKMVKQGKSNKEIFEDTNWFKDKVTGKLKYNFSDKNMEIINHNYKVGQEYTLEQMLKHDILFEIYPQLRNYKVKIENLNINNNNKGKLNGRYNRYTNELSVDINRFDKKSNAEGTLIHEIQHAIQKIEGFSRGTSVKKGMQKYNKNPGEVEAKDTAQRMKLEKYKGIDLSNNLPKSAKINTNLLEKMKIGLYNYLDNISDEVEVNENIQKNQEKMAPDISENNGLVLGGIEKDNQGRTLTKEQQEYFKESKVRDENGNLKTVFHGTPYEFNQFKYDKLGENTSSLGAGFYFTDKQSTAEEYKRDGGNVKEVYLDIKNPISYGKTTITKSEFSKFVNEINNKTNGRLAEDYGDIQYAIDEHDFGGDDIDLISSIKISSGLSWEETYDILRKSIGKDGIISEKGFLNKGENIYVAFNSNQIKNADNTNPTDNPDIRYAYQSNGAWQSFVDKYFKSESKGSTLKQARLPERPVTIEDYNKLLDETKFIPNEDKKALLSEVENVEMNRTTLKDFGEVVKEMEDVYKQIDDEILDTNKTYTTGREETYKKYKKSMTEYDATALEKAKGNIPANHQGRRTKEQWLNIANQIGNEIANKSNNEIEEIAYKTWQDEKPNSKAKLNRQGQSYVEFTSDEWINAVYDSVKDSRIMYGIDTEDNNLENAQNEGSILLPQNPKKNVSMPMKMDSEDATLKVNISDTYKTNTKKQTENKVAEILSKPVTQQKESDRTWAILGANILDKGLVFENMSLKANNRELQAKWDYSLLSQSIGQNAIGNSRYEFKDGKQTKICKGLSEIIDEVGEKTNDFQNYMYHQLNIDRMTLKDRFGIDNKPVFGDNITADYSKRKVAEFEENNPEFKKWAKDVYDYANADKSELVKNGVISQELSNKFSEMYPHYIPIKRVNTKGNAINVPLDTNRTGINSPIKKATGGSLDINPLFETMAERTLQTYRASARNSLGIELKNTLQVLNELNAETNQESLDNIIESINDEDTNKTMLTEGTKTTPPTFTIFQNGEKITFDINKDIYNALKPQNELISEFNKTKLSKVLNKIGNIRRGILTEYNPVFMITNSIKDAQDVLMNSQHAVKTYSKFPESYAQIVSKGYWYNEYIQNGGEQNTYFKDGEFEKVKTGVLPGAKNVITMPFKKISQVNNIIEMAPRLAEYIASRESGRSIQTSMLDASRVTTNFKAGGDVTKLLNRNGVTFLNAGVQGTMQAVRNVREANAQGLKGWAILAGKTIIAGTPALLLNHLLWGDDDDYNELQDYVKDNYYIIGKIGDNQFLRIPKGRVVSVIQKVVTNIDDYINNKQELNIDNVASDIWEDLKFGFDNVAPNNPIENNVLSPIIQAITNTSWYGEDIVPSRLQKLPSAEQYDESTDKFSKWLGEKTGVSPKKINYLLDQYTGGVGDVLLPMGTPQAENNVIEDKFTTDSTMKSKYPGEFFEKIDKLEINKNSSNVTDSDKVKYKYMSSISGEMSELYKKKREIQNSKLTDEEKKKELKNVQKEINTLARTGIETVDKIQTTNTTAIIGDKQYYKQLDEWEELTEEEKEKNKNISLKTYSDYKTKIKQNTEQKQVKMNDEDVQLNNNEKIKLLQGSTYSTKEKDALYSNYIMSKSDDKSTEYEELKEYYTNNSVLGSKNYRSYDIIEQYLDYKVKADDKIKELRANGTKKENENLSDKEKTQLLVDSKYTNSQTEAIYVNVVASDTNKEKYEIVKQMNGGNKINTYLEYILADKESDKEDDGSKNGKSISGTKKKKVVSAIQNTKLNKISKIYLLGTEYDLNTNKELPNYYALKNYLKTQSKSDQLRIVKTLKGKTEMKNGKYEY